MSRGAGHVERAIAATFTAQPNRIYTVEQLAEVVYPVAKIEKRHRVPVIRAANKVADRMWWSWKHAEIPGGHLIYFNLCDVRSYAMAKEHHYYANRHDGRDWQNMHEWFDEPEYQNHNIRISDREPGGPWHDHVQLNCAERDGRELDPELAQRMNERTVTWLGMFGTPERRAKYEAAMADRGRGWE